MKGKRHSAASAAALRGSQTKCGGEEAGEDPPHAWTTATHCAIPLQWTIGHMGRRQQEKRTDLLTFLPPLPRQSTPYMTKSEHKRQKRDDRCTLDSSGENK